MHAAAGGPAQKKWFQANLDQDPSPTGCPTTFFFEKKVGQIGFVDFVLFFVFGFVGELFFEKKTTQTHGSTTDCFEKK